MSSSWPPVDPGPDAVEDVGAAVRQDQPRLRVLPAAAVHLIGHLGHALTGLDHDGEPSLVGEREHVVEPPVVAGEPLPPRMQLEPGRSASPGDRRPDPAGPVP